MEREGEEGEAEDEEEVEVDDIECSPLIIEGPVAWLRVFE